jgi:hypothetical protein
MLFKLVVLAVLIIGTNGAQAQAQRNTDVPSGPAVWPLIKSPAPPQGGAAPNGNTPEPQAGGDSKRTSAGTDPTGAVGSKGNGSDTRGK